MTRNQSGFSLIEMLIVIALMALAGTFVTINVTKRFREAKVNATKIQMRQMLVILEDFYRVCGFYPSQEQGLDALIHAPQGRECKNYDPAGFFQNGKVPKDGWNNDFLYFLNGNKPELKSLGEDGKEGGTGFDQDLSSNEID